MQSSWGAAFCVKSPSNLPGGGPWEGAGCSRGVIGQTQPGAIPWIPPEARTASPSLPGLTAPTMTFLQSMHPPHMWGPPDKPLLCHRPDPALPRSVARAGSFQVHFQSINYQIVTQILALVAKPPPKPADRGTSLQRLHWAWIHP